MTNGMELTLPDFVTSRTTTDKPLVALNESSLISSRHEFERFVPPGGTINDVSAQSYLKKTFNVTSSNSITLQMVQLRLRLMEELADQEDVIFDLEREYNDAVASNHLSGLLRGWDGAIHPKKCMETLPKETRKFYSEAAKQKDHAFSFTSISSKAYSLQPELAQQLHHRVMSGHPSQPQSTTNHSSLPISPLSPSASACSPSGSISSVRRRPSLSSPVTLLVKDEKHKRKHDVITPSNSPLPDTYPEVKREDLPSLKRRVKITEEADAPIYESASERNEIAEEVQASLTQLPEADLPSQGNLTLPFHDHADSAEQTLSPPRRRGAGTTNQQKAKTPPTRRSSAITRKSHKVSISEEHCIQPILDNSPASGTASAVASGSASGATVRRKIPVVSTTIEDQLADESGTRSTRHNSQSLNAVIVSPILASTPRVPNRKGPKKANKQQNAS